jgi:hypothetical protein
MLPPALFLAAYTFENKWFSQRTPYLILRSFSALEKIAPNRKKPAGIGSSDHPIKN